MDSTGNFPIIKELRILVGAGIVNYTVVISRFLYPRLFLWGIFPFFHFLLNQDFEKGRWAIQQDIPSDPRNTSKGGIMS